MGKACSPRTQHSDEGQHGACDARRAAGGAEMIYLDLLACKEFLLLPADGSGGGGRLYPCG